MKNRFEWYSDCISVLHTRAQFQLVSDFYGKDVFMLKRWIGFWMVLLTSVGAASAADGDYFPTAT